MIAAVATVLNEADIVGISIEHLLASGVSRVYVAHGPSTDGTLDILHSFGDDVMVVPDHYSFHDQPTRTAELANLAAIDGAEWVLPFDADEFPYIPDVTDLAEAFAGILAGINKLIIQRWMHTDWEHRYVQSERLPKVAWRTDRPFVCHPGNHDVTIETDGICGGLMMREIQFRSFEHMVRKSRERIARIDPSFGPQYGTHQRRLAALSGAALEEAWADLMAVPTVVDPIPVRRRSDAHV